MVATHNFLSPLDFTFRIRRMPNVEFYIQSCSIPAISVNQTEYQTPFSKISLGGDHIDYGDFNLTFRVDEDMNSYLEIFNWIIGLSFPDNFDQYKNLKQSVPGDGLGEYSDATLTILNSNSRPNIIVTFEDLYPKSLGEILLDTKNTDIQYAEATATFGYQRFRVTQA